MEVSVINLSEIAACAVAVIILTSVIKQFVKWKHIFVFAPVIIALPLGIMLSVAAGGSVQEIIMQSFKYWVSIFMTAMSSYDIVAKTIKQFTDK